MLLEVIATTLTDAKAAVAGGADRIELITGIAEGGLTPSYGLIERVVHQVDLPVQVMVRPHSRSVCYNRDDLETMVRDIRMIKQIGMGNSGQGGLGKSVGAGKSGGMDASDGMGNSARLGQSGHVGIVLGALTPDGMIDEASLQLLLDEAGSMDVTFHRAFDEAADLFKAYETLTKYAQIRRVLTSGGQPSALLATDQISRLVEMSKHSHVEILAGAGLTAGTLSDFIRRTGVREVHFGSGVRRGKGELDYVDVSKVQTVREITGTLG